MKKKFYSPQVLQPLCLSAHKYNYKNIAVQIPCVVQIRHNYQNAVQDFPEFVIRKGILLCIKWNKHNKTQLPPLPNPRILMM